ncbi:FAD-dependent oxidoreductase [Streptomyces sp. MP131-18]|uniref:NAD(P)/FAD-dependent oxidoreductase n=1 Tax=Streptomyces sp. MP131-18 TaxID=1857892 RepID=UPI00097BAF1D|nr:FAD-dependent oxidoreductase [Streptomyces sp. MP131-18]ONK12932.1 D-amino acid dehydrogenase small subunit [Streptomyces sp. MP131-18]
MSAVVVVGAGIVGASVAYHLARRGVPVTLLEQGPGPGTGVTADSFAWVGGSGGDWPGGAQDLREYVLADYERLEAELPDVTLRRTGSLNWGGGPDQESRLMPGQFRVGRSDITALEPNLRHPPDQAVHVPGDAGVDATALTGALVAAAEAHGATVRYETAVTSLQLSGERVEGVLSATGPHSAATVVLTAGTNVPQLCEPLPADLPVAASPATLARVAAPPGLVRTIVARPDLEVREVRDGELLLVLPHVDGPAALRERAAQDALRRLRTAFRGSDECRLLGYRTGRRPMPAHGPLIGYATHDRSVYVAVMHPGVTLAPTVGRLVADELVTARPARELLRCRPRVH